jgi:hypothetical protein
VTVRAGSLPVKIRIFQKDRLLSDQVFNTSLIQIDSIPGGAVGEAYKVVAIDDCGNVDSVNSNLIASVVEHKAEVFDQCPSALWQQGSGRIRISTFTNMGSVSVKIIKKDGGFLTPELAPNTAVGGIYNFNDLRAGTYLIRYQLSDVCNRSLYDTVTIKPYTYPNLTRSSGYQCDVSGFSVSAVASNGIGPFTYEIIGNTPKNPSIIRPPQADPVFNIDNGYKYSLIRLRALDACGNAALGDASILPLAAYKIVADSNCFQSSATLSVDTIYNSTYSWYKKRKHNSIDSTYLGSGYKLFIPFVSAGDTGTYICDVRVNTGCVNRSYRFNLTGLCYNYLPITVKDFNGKLVQDQVELAWKASQEIELRAYVVERSNVGNNFAEIGRVTAGRNSSGEFQYNFIDPSPRDGENFYRLKLLSNTLHNNFSNTILLVHKRPSHVIRVYPNPVINELSVGFEKAGLNLYRVQLLSMANQVVYETTVNADNSRDLHISRQPFMKKGVYILKCVDLFSNTIFTKKIIFQ